MLEDLISRFGTKLYINVSNAEEVKQIRENLNLIGAWQDLVSTFNAPKYWPLRGGYKYTLTINETSNGNFIVDWYDPKITDQKHSYVYIDKDFILNPLADIIKEIREEIHGVDLSHQYDAQAFADRNISSSLDTTIKF